MVNININTTFFKTRHGLFKIVEFVRRRSVSTNLILSQVLVLVVLMIVRFDKNYQFGPVGDSGASGIGESNFLATAKATLDKITSMGGGSGGGMGDGDFLGMVSLSNAESACYQHQLLNVCSTFLLQGVIVGYAIIVPCILLNYIIGGGVSQLEFFINFVGGVLFFIVGCLGLSCEAYATGVLTLGIGILFLVDFGLAYAKTKFVS